jgi:hypothetical protein
MRSTGKLIEIANMRARYEAEVAASNAAWRTERAIDF